MIHLIESRQAPHGSLPRRPSRSAEGGLTCPPLSRSTISAAVSTVVFPHKGRTLRQTLPSVQRAPCPRDALVQRGLNIGLEERFGRGAPPLEEEDSAPLVNSTRAVTGGIPGGWAPPEPLEAHGPDSLRALGRPPRSAFVTRLLWSGVTFQGMFLKHTSCAW